MRSGVDGQDEALMAAWLCHSKMVLALSVWKQREAWSGSHLLLKVLSQGFKQHLDSCKGSRRTAPADRAQDGETDEDDAEHYQELATFEASKVSFLHAVQVSTRQLQGGQESGVSFRNGCTCRPAGCIAPTPCCM